MSIVAIALAQVLVSECKFQSLEGFDVDRRVEMANAGPEFVQFQSLEGFDVDRRTGARGRYVYTSDVSIPGRV